MTTNRGKSILASRLPLAFQEMYQCEVIIEMIASYLVGEKLVRQEGRFPCGAIIFTEQKKKKFDFMTLHLYLNICRERYTEVI